LINRIQYVVDTPAARFADVLGKAAFSVSMTLKLLVIGGMLHIFAVFAIALVSRFFGYSPSTIEILAILVGHPIYQATMGFAAIMVIRRILLRLGDVEIQQRNAG